MTYAGITDWEEFGESGDETTPEGVAAQALAQVASGSNYTAADTTDAASEVANAYLTSGFSHSDSLGEVANWYAQNNLSDSPGSSSSGGGGGGGGGGGPVGGLDLATVALLAVAAGGVVYVAT